MSTWPLVELGKVAEVSSGDGAPQETSAFGESGTPFIRAGSLVSLLDGGSENQLERIPEDESSKRRMHTYPPHTIVFAKSGMSCTKGLIYELEGNAHVVNHLAALECGNDLSPRFLLRWFQMNSPSRLIANPAYPSIKISSIRSEKIPLPPLAEQKRIAGILDTADTLRVKRRESLAQLDALVQSVFLDMFGDPATNPRRWEALALGDIIDPDRPVSYGILKPGEYQEDGVIMLRIQDIRGGNVAASGFHRVSQALSQQYKRTLLSGGEVVVSLVGTIGLSAVIPPNFAKANVHRNLAVVVPRKGIEPRYLKQYIASGHFQRLIKDVTKGGNQGLLNLGDLKRLPILIAPRDLQNRFATIVESIYQLKGRKLNHLAELDNLFISLQSRAFNGEL